jgi:hypothetical protein
MNSKNRQEMSDWINMKLKFINAIIKQAQLSHNYGKEIQYAGMREAYLEFLQKINSEHFGEAAA